MKYIYDDGGREDAGYKGYAGDCVCRAIAIATGQSYEDVYSGLNDLRAGMRQTKRVRGSHSRNGVNRIVYDKYLKARGWEWTPTMQIGSGCVVHVKDGELPEGTLILRLSKHITTIIDGAIHDTFDPSRNGTRCVYGYYKQRSG